MGWGLGGQSCGHHCSITFPGRAVPSVSRWMGSPLGWVSGQAGGVSPHPWDAGKESQRTCGWGEAV